MAKHSLSFIWRRSPVELCKYFLSFECELSALEETRFPKWRCFSIHALMNRSLNGSQLLLI
ncbi:hypothetical protein LguiA_021397 [Lonicera macranthoides]